MARSRRRTGHAPLTLIRFRSVLRREVRAIVAEGHADTDRKIAEARAEARQYTEQRVTEGHADTDRKIAEARAEARQYTEQRVAEGHADTDRKIAEARAEARQYTEQRVAEGHADTDRKIAEARAHTERLMEELRAQHVETRRHLDVVAERLGGRSALVAEGLAGLDQKVDRFREEVAGAFRRVDRRFLKLEVRLGRREAR